ncbi:MAG TPA: response regulator, partial [Rhodocyclaceae bacterium]|nr:response regulator [Rhodocyclaceae bacterium]
MSTGNLTVCIVDDDEQVRRFLVEAMRSVGNTAEEYASGVDFMQRWQRQSAGCILLDIRMPRVTGPEVHDWLRRQNSDVPVIFLSSFADVPTAVRAMRLGAFDFLEKPPNVQHLIERVNAALQLTEARRADADLPTLEGADWLETLTPREHEILRGIVAGKRNKNNASDLGISERTVETHRYSIMAKAKARTVAELIS